MIRMGLAYYNEHDKKAAAWLERLIGQGLIAPGRVDSRDLQKVNPEELSEYTQVHLFAGIGGWSLALRLAGWPDDRPIWTGSCPCQPFSSAGKKKGVEDERHVWPIMCDYIEFCRPAKCFGEQVASPDGREWLAGVQAGVEALGYQFAAADLCAAGVGAPHIRQRLYWLAHSCSADGERLPGELPPSQEGVGRSGQFDGDMPVGPEYGCQNYDWSIQGVADSPSPRHSGSVEHTEGDSRDETRLLLSRANSEVRHWDTFGVVRCRDPRGGPNLLRRVEPGTFPLAHGVPRRVELLKGYGNAIVPALAAEFILAVEEALELIV